MTIYSFANGQSVEIYPRHKRKNQHIVLLGRSKIFRLDVELKKIKFRNDFALYA